MAWSGRSVSNQAPYILVKFCEWCGHSGAGHMFEPLPDSKQDTQICQVGKRVQTGPKEFMVVPCGCNKTGPKMTVVEPTPLPPPPQCIVCGSVTEIADTWCSQACKDLTIATLRGEPIVVPETGVQEEDVVEDSFDWEPEILLSTTPEPLDPADKCCRCLQVRAIHGDAYDDERGIYVIHDFQEEP